jgi:hypothetical protein
MMGDVEVVGSRQFANELRGTTRQGGQDHDQTAMSLFEQTIQRPAG